MSLHFLPAFPGLTGIRAFFTTRLGGFSTGAYASLNLSFFTGDDPETVKRNWETVLRTQGLAHTRLVLPRLCHGTRLQKIPDQAEKTESPDTVSLAPMETDAVSTQSGEWTLAVTMGDCLAALIADPQNRCVAAVHAGWRGTRDNILGHALRELFSSGHCRPESTSVALGPCLSTTALELPEAILRTLPAAHVYADGFDLRGCNRDQAIAEGVSPERLHVESGCTRSETNQFFSYRRDGTASGRMAACIALV